MWKQKVQENRQKPWGMQKVAAMALSWHFNKLPVLTCFDSSHSEKMGPWNRFVFLLGRALKSTELRIKHPDKKGKVNPDWSKHPDSWRLAIGQKIGTAAPQSSGFFNSMVLIYINIYMTFLICFFGTMNNGQPTWFFNGNPWIFQWKSNVWARPIPTGGSTEALFGELCDVAQVTGIDLMESAAS